MNKIEGLDITYTDEEAQGLYEASLPGNKYGEKLYKWGELADYPDKKFQREDWINGYIFFNPITGGVTQGHRFGDPDPYLNYHGNIKDWKLNWREYVE